MNKYKKIGLTALAASLVSVSAHAGEISVAGSASMNVEGYTGERLNAGSGFSMGNQLTFSGSGELDNGMTVSLSFVLDQGDDTTTQVDATNSFGGGAPFDSHSVKVSSDSMGTLTLAGEGGSSTATSIDGTAAGDIWDTFDGARGAVTAVKVSDSSPGDNSLFYTLPSMMDGLDVNLSYQPQGAGKESGTGYGVSYTGVEGLTVKYASADEVGTTTALSGDQTVYNVSYAYGPVTATVSESDFDVETATSDQETSSYAISYTVTDELSITYGVDEINKGATATDAEYSAISASYTSGGMTLSAAMKDAENVDHTTNSTADFEYWTLGASFAF
ncbi:porin [Candidatus Pelagibacter sp.]|nr:porin [Candidatus Pelagibacter sp.]